MTVPFKTHPKIKPYVEDPNLPPVHPSNYFEQLEPRIILGSCLAFGGAESLLSQAAAAEPQNAITIPPPAFLNESLALRAARPATEIPSLYTISHDPLRSLLHGDQEGGYFHNRDRNQQSWVVPQAGGASLTGKDTDNLSKELPEVGLRNGRGSAGRGSSSSPSSGGGASVNPIPDPTPKPPEPEFIIEPIKPGPNPNPTDPTNPVNPTPSSPVLGASGASTIPVGKEYTLNLSITGPGSDTVKYWTIDWGDGKVEQIEGNPDKAKHVYEKTGDYIIKTSATNADKTYAGASVPVRVTENRPPEFVSEPNTEAGVDRPWNYDAKAVDPDGDNLTYSLVSGPGGMTIDTNTGRLSWTPGAQYVGSHQVVIEARDPGGLSCRQEFTLTVAQDLQNRPPEITSTPGTTGYVGKDYTYQVEARDPDGDLLTYTLEEAPAGMAIDSQTGLITWKPTAEMADQTFTVKILVEDGYGGSATQEYQITVLTPKNNGAPVFVTDPNTTHYTPEPSGQATGNVSVNGIDSMNSIHMALDIDEIKKQLVSLTMDEVPPMVDIFLFFDYSGSFTTFARALAEQFPIIIKALTEAMPEVSFAFGIGMHVTYGGEDGYSAAQRPFILRQPMVTSETEGFIESIKAGLTGYNVAGNPYLTTLEALYQIATGKGFDGNNDGDTTDSGPAGPRENQNKPGTSGDVPAFDSFVPDPDNNVLPPAGDIGGVGFRKGALPIIIAATDEEFWYQPDGRETITGRDGVEIPSDYFKNYPTGTPHGNGATIQETIDALNAIGAVVVGWGTERARHGMEAISKLTGSVNGSSESIHTGFQNQTIDEGDAYFFRMQQEATKVTEGLIKMVQSIMLNTSNSIEVIASKDGVPFANLTGVINNVAPGQKIDFDISFLGDGREHSFDIQFIKAGTGVVLGTIPVTIGAAYTYDARAIDPDGDEITYSLVGDTHGATIDKVTGSIVWDGLGNGAFKFTVRATDEFGNYTDQVFDIQVGDRPYVSGAPVIHGVTSDQAEVGRQFSSQVEADSPNGEPMTYYLIGDIPEGLTMDKKTGAISWLPALGQDNSYEITIRVVSSEGATAEMSFTLEVLPKQINRNTKPTFTSQPIETAIYDKEYRYQVKARDAEGDPITLRLLMAPEGVVFDPISGLLIWTPSEADLGDHTIIIQADDGNGGLNAQVFTINVNDGNVPPIFTSTPPAPSYAGSSYLYVVKTTDPNGDPVALTLDDVSIANGITLDSETGLLAWNNIPAGEYQITITASDGRGGVSTQAFVLQITSNKPARITSDAVTIAIKGYQYAYHVETYDPNGDPVTLTLDQASKDRGMFIDAGGVLRWMPTEVGEYAVTLTATDPSGAGMVQQFVVNVVLENVAANRTPAITSTPETLAWENAAYSYQVIASDPDGDKLTYTISSDKTASGLYINATNGQITWTSPVAGEYNITVTVKDTLGATAFQVFKLVVKPFYNRPPVITSTPGQYYFNVDEDHKYELKFTDPDIAKHGDACTVTVDGISAAKGVTVTPSTATSAFVNWSFQESGYHTITITVTDKAGLQSVQTFTVYVFDGSENRENSPPPHITSTPKTHTVRDVDYSYQVVATGKAGSTLSYSVDSDSQSRGIAISNDGLLSWKPGTVGEYPISVIVTDEHGAQSVQTFVLNVEEPLAQNAPARFTSDFELLGRVGEEYRLLLEGEDPEGGLVKFSFSGPSGMKLEGNELVWTPTYATTTTVSVTILDEQGCGETKSFKITVINKDNGTYYYANGYTGEYLEYEVNYPYVGTPISTTIDSASQALGISFEDGKIKWTPTTAYNGHRVAITVKTDANRTHTLYVYLYIVNKNQPPVITSVPPAVAYKGEFYEYQLQAHDPEGGKLTYSVTYSGNYLYNMVIDENGLLSTGKYNIHSSQMDTTIKVTVKDDHGNTTTQIYSLVVVQPMTNRPPYFTTDITKNVYEIGVDSLNTLIYADDPDWSLTSDRLTFSLNQEAIDAGFALTPYVNQKHARLVWSPKTVGSHKVILTVTDSHGATAVKEFTVHAVERHNRPVRITSTAPTFAWIDEKYTYNIATSDGNNDTVTLTIDQASLDRGMVLTKGSLTWTPTELGEFQVTITATDNNGSISQQTYSILVTQREWNHTNKPAVITSEPTMIGAVGQEYRYEIVASDPEGGPVTLTLDAKSLERGMYLDGNTLVWEYPPRAQGYYVSITVKDEHGEGVTQRFRLVIIENSHFSRPPSISSTPSQIAVVGREYQYQVVASDPDGDQLVYTMVKGPAGMSIDPKTGLIVFKPTKAGTHEVEITVSDGNHILSQVYTLAVVPNIPPQISTSPNQNAYVGQEYMYQPQATDPNGDGFTWSLESTVPGMTIDSQTGKITFNPAEAGVVDVVLVVRDEHGAESRQKWNILVRDPNANTPPVIHSEIRGTIQVGTQLLHQLVATDPDGDALSYSLVSGPLGMIVTASGLLSWTPSSSEIGIHNFTIRVTDERGAVTEKTYSIAVVSQPVPNKAPEVTNTPPAYAVVGEEWVYVAQASDPEGDTVSFSLDSGPAGMTIDPKTGRYSWRPTAAQLGEHEITFTVVDSYGAYSTYAWTITVQMANTAPTIISTPPTVGKVGQPWTYQVVAKDGEGDSFTFSLGQNVPSTMVIDPQTGRITFTSDVVGQFEVEVFVKDSRGALSSQKFILAIKQDSVNLPPHIESQPTGYAAPGKEYVYQIVAHDPNGDALAYGLAKAPAGMTIDQNGRVSWTPTALQAGDHRVEVTVYDGEIGVMQGFIIRVFTNTAPTFNAMDDKTITAGKDFLLDAVAHDADNDLLTYELIEAPEGMTIDSHGRITWQTDDSHAGTGSKTHTVIVRARDPFMEEALVSFTVTVNRDTVAPEVFVTPNKVPAAIYDPVSFWVQAHDEGGIARMELSIDGKIIAMNEYGISTHVFDAAGVHTIVATAWDAAGNKTEKEITLLVYDPSDRTPPVVKWNVPGNLVVEKPFELKASVHDPDSAVVTWTLTMQSKDTGVIRTLASGSGAITDAFLAGIDPAEMANGPYILTLHAIDGSGHESKLSQVVTVKSQYKVGNFNLSFQDMQVNLGGIPIIIQRTYDTFDAGKNGDFGYGWTMSYIPVSLKDNIGVDLQKDPTSALYIDAAFYLGAKITVRMPDGKTEVFTVDYEAPIFQLPGQNTYKVKFKAESGSGATLALAGGSPYFSLDEEGRFVAGGMPFNPASPYTPYNYVLTTDDGMQFNIDGKTGQCTRAHEPGGNYLEVRDNGIRSYDSEGKLRGEVIFERDDKGRITAIKDTDGQTVTYEYDAKGDLVAVTSSNTGTVTIDYINDDGAPDHYLKSITDKEGVKALDVGYDYVTGRITSITDAAGNSTGVSFTTQVAPGLTAESVTNALGYVTETVVDSDGNIVRTIKHIPDANNPTNRDKLRYQITVEEFDAKGNSLGRARPFEVSEAELRALGKNQYDYLPADLFWESRAKYDAKGNQTQSVDAYGQTTYYSYDNRGNLLTTVDPLGRVTKNAYDSKGRLTKTTDASGTISVYEYSGDNIKSITQILPDGTKQVQNAVEYNRAGKVTSMTDANGNVTRYGYDNEGRQISTQTESKDPHDPTKTHIAATYNEYNAEGKVTKTWQEVDGVRTSLTEYTYTTSGQTETTTDKYGLVSKSVYDIAGREIETRRQAITEKGEHVWLVSRIVYDAVGQVTWQQDEHVETDPDHPQSANATHTVYDSLGRVIRSEHRDNVLITVTGEGATIKTEVAAAGALVSASETGYDTAGRTAWSKSATGVVTVYYYTSEGAISHTTIDRDGDLSSTNDQYATNQIKYDEYGRQIESILDRDGALSTTGDQTITQYKYDSQGRLVQTIYNDGTTTEVTYDAMGRKASETNQLGDTTHYEYDSQGRLTAVILPEAKHPTSGEMVHVRYEYAYDAMGNQISLKDNIFQTDPANAATIDKSGMRETQFTYDWRNNQTSRTLPDGSKEYFHYDAYGRQSRHISFEGRVTYYEYDALDRLSGKYYYSSEAAWNNKTVAQSITYTYDLYGRVIKEVDSAIGTTTTGYNAEGAVSRITSEQGTINYEYDKITGQVTRTWTGTDANNPITDVRNTYDAEGRLETVTTHAREGALLENKETAQYIYDIIGNLDKIVHANGIISDYEYDELNRLKELTHYAPDATPDDLSDNDIAQRYTYDYYKDGNKSRETFTDAEGKVHTWDWVYDQLGRLIRETHDNADNTLDYDTFYKYDLVGNRLEKSTDNDLDGIIDEVIRAKFDKNDRLLNEWKLLDGKEVERTDYAFNKTEQIAKTVTNLVTAKVETKTSMLYNAQGRMEKIVIESFINGVKSKEVTQTYAYDSADIKVRQTETIDANADGTLDVTSETNYLNDNQNHTGYSQVLEERRIENGKEVKVTTYTIGHDVLSQFTQALGTLTLLTDGHGSTRAVANAAGNILQQYNYDAYGNAHGFNPSEAHTNLLYSGEQFNPVSGLQYLRARWYNPNTGRFNKLDPYFGNRSKPITFHKYAYAALNPIMFADPAGLMPTLGSMMSAMRTGLNLTMSFARSAIGFLGHATKVAAKFVGRLVVNEAKRLVADFKLAYPIVRDALISAARTASGPFVRYAKEAVVAYKDLAVSLYNMVDLLYTSLVTFHFTAITKILNWMREDVLTGANSIMDYWGYITNPQTAIDHLRQINNGLQAIFDFAVYSVKTTAGKLWEAVNEVIDDDWGDHDKWLYNESEQEHLLA